VGVLGIALIAVIDRLVPEAENPHEAHPVEDIGNKRKAHHQKALLRMGLMSALAIGVHNFPEGLATFAAALADPQLGVAIAVAIAIHNIPEGVAVAGPFRACGMPRWRYIGWATLSGLSEPIAALLGAAFVSLLGGLLPTSLAFAGGAMLYVVSDELIPESHSHGYEHQATWGFVAGFIILLILMRIV